MPSSYEQPGFVVGREGQWHQRRSIPVAAVGGSRGSTTRFETTAQGVLEWSADAPCSVRVVTGGGRGLGPADGSSGSFVVQGWCEVTAASATNTVLHTSLVPGSEARAHWYALGETGVGLSVPRGARRWSCDPAVELVWATEDGTTWTTELASGMAVEAAVLVTPSADTLLVWEW